MSRVDETARGDEDRSAEELLAQLEQLRAENRRLRRAYAATQRTRYRRTAVGLYLLGALGVSAAVLFPNTRGVLFALGATGLFAGLLTYYLTPERFVAARVSERVAAAHGATLHALIADLGLQEAHVYVPLTDGHDAQAADVLLFVPQAAAYELPPSPSPGIAAPENRRSRGLFAVPTGGTLLREFERTLDRPLPSDIDRLAEQLADGLTEQFELADAVRTERTSVTNDGIDPSTATADASETTRLAVVIEEPAFEPGTVDDPLTSFVSAGVAKGLDAPVEIAERATSEGGTYRLALEWDESRRAESDA
ncbi:hypothetical protein [Haloplanus halobius]|uniref:hypothetical protein n=1 Tax=Haloplanus halobius TaxID=2934938 RepID=UPI00200F3EAC|nr:hypothetical protein [Haloplanus sp. XH21]